MKHYLLSITFFLLPITLFSQSFQWLQNGGGNNTVSNDRKEEVIDMATDSQRNIYVLSTVTMDNVSVNSSNPIAVTTYEAWSVTTDFILISYTCNGMYRWHKVFWGGAFDFPKGIVIDNQDNVYVSGRVTQCSDNNGSNPYYSMPRIGDNNGIDYTFSNTSTSCLHMFITKFNTNGVFQWIHFAHAPVDSSVANASGIARNFYIVNDVIYWLVQLAPGSYENGAFNNTNTAVPYTTYILKYDTSGTFINAIAFDLQVSSYISSEVRWYRNPYNGNFYAIHAYNSNSNNTITAGGNTLSNTFSKIICFNDLGQYQWHRETTGTSMNLTSIDFDAQNNVYIAGVADSNFGGSFLSWSVVANTGSTAFVMKCNANVTTYNWVNNYTSNNGIVGISQGLSPQVLYNAYTNEVLFAGSIRGEMFWSAQTNNGPGPNNGMDPLLAKFDSTTGTCTSLNRLVGNNGFDDGFTKMALDNNGDLLLGGYMGYQLTDSNNVDYYSNGGNS
ncbi:hypothetical protein, partial [uncultured Flavobacterium sp.]|uniref:hypothetical protein n=1 Tax=uncultured Flavobacterium sp. TaxID=165435 RepID=UPI0030C7CC0F